MSLQLRGVNSAKLIKRRLVVGISALALMLQPLVVLPMPAFATSLSNVTVCASVCDYTSLQDAVDAVTSGGTITLNGDLTLGSEVTVSRPMTINGNGHSVSPTFPKNSNDNNASIGIVGTNNVSVNNLTIHGSAGTNLHGINIYESTSVSLGNDTITDNDHNGIVVNGSTVTVTNLTSANNGWGGIDVDQGSGVTMPASLTINGTSSHSGEFAVIIDHPSNPDVTFTDNTGQYYEVLPGMYLAYAHPVPSCSTDDTTFDTFGLGSVNGQHGWSATNSSIDQAITTNSYGYTSFGCKTLRISNAHTTGSFGDQIFSYSVANEAGETSAENGGLSGGTRKTHFEASWDFASATGSYQPGLSVTASPDRGDGARMSWIQMEDTSSGLAVNFYDYAVGNTVDSGPCGCAPFRYTTVASGLDRTVPHTVKVTMDFVDGSKNDVVKVYVDGVLVHTGTSWEDYFRNEEGNPTRTVDSLLFRVSGTAAPSTNGNGFLVDNVNISTRDDTVKPTATLTQPVVGSYNPTQMVVVAHDETALNHVTANIYNESNTTLLKSCSASAGGATDYTLTCAVPSTLSDGVYTIRANANDLAGHTSTTTTRQFTVDKTAPAAPALVSPSNGAVVNGASITQAWSDSSSDVDHYIYESYNDAGASSPRYHTTYTSTSKTATNVGETTYWWRLKAVDAAGNVSGWSPLWKITVDNTAPDVSITAPINGHTVSGTVVISGTVTDANPDHYYLVVKDASHHVVAGPGTVTAANVADYNWDTTSLPDGTYTIDLEARDAAGNKDSGSVQTVSVTVDNTAPVVTGDNYIGTSASPSLSGTVDDAAATVTVAIDGGSAEPATNNGYGTWSFVPSTTLSTGLHTAEVVATDAAGNSSSTSFIVTVLAITLPSVVHTSSTPSPNSNATIPQFFATTTPSSSNPANTNDNGKTLGTSDQKANNDKGNVLGESTSSQNSNCGAIFGVCWYWWVPAVVAIVLVAWYVIRRRHATSDAV